MPRGWMRDLDHGVESAVANRARAAEMEQLDLRTYVRAALDGAVGDLDLETLRTRDDAIAAIERCLVARFRRPLSPSERSAVALEVALEWNRRVPPAAPEFVQVRWDELMLADRKAFMRGGYGY
jgi:hypothetical protein